jgi:hypothetical protein
VALARQRVAHCSVLVGRGAAVADVVHLAGGGVGGGGGGGGGVGCGGQEPDCVAARERSAAQVCVLRCLNAHDSY